MKITTTIAAVVTIGAALLLGACSSETPAAPEPTTSIAPSNEPTTPVPEETPAVEEPVEEAPTPEPPAPAADEYSQVVNGTLFQGTEKAPVRIGQDAPGQAPAIESEITVENWDTASEAANKYLVYVSPDGKGSYFYKVFGLSRHGSFRELDNKDYSTRTFASQDEAIAAPKSVDGRILDRAEYSLFVE